ncbi:hypothetical protein AX15_001533 [Amanita polypyramis BW_CC]|nr:hypothetical protein AX15_001533 [Amanita polypyramis BW_CC]
MAAPLSHPNPHQARRRSLAAVLDNGVESHMSSSTSSATPLSRHLHPSSSSSPSRPISIPVHSLTDNDGAYCRSVAPVSAPAPTQASHAMVPSTSQRPHSVSHTDSQTHTLAQGRGTSSSPVSIRSSSSSSPIPLPFASPSHSHPRSWSRSSSKSRSRSRSNSSPGGHVKLSSISTPKPMSVAVAAPGSTSMSPGTLTSTSTATLKPKSSSNTDTVKDKDRNKDASAAATATSTAMTSDTNLNANAANTTSSTTPQAQTQPSPPTALPSTAPASTFTKPRSRAPKSTTASTALTSTNATTAANARAHSRTRSPSPRLTALPPPVQTIRLEIKLGGPENYEIDVSALAKATGQRPSTPAPIGGGSGKLSGRDGGESSGSESEGGGERGDDKSDKGGEGGEGGTKKKRKKKKKHTASEYYDITDPFIDDSELAIDERTWFAQTKQQGFYVSSGEVALLKDKPKKPKSKKAPANSSVGTKGGKENAGVEDAITTGGARTYLIARGDDEARGERGDDGGGLGTGGGGSIGDAGIGGGSGDGSVRGDEGDEEVGQKRKRYITVVDQAGKKRKIVDVNSFHPEIQAEIERLKEAIAKENWSQKGKFPPAIKPLLNTVAMLAVKLGEYDDHFFSLMPTLFPYNKFTMSKLIKRTVFHEHVQFLAERQESLLKELSEQAKAGFAKAEEEWERSVQAWDKRQEKAWLEAATAGTAGGFAPSAGTGTGEAGESIAPTRHPTEEMDVDGDTSRSKEKEEGLAPPSTSVALPGLSGTQGPGGGTGGGGGGKDAHPPAKKYRLTEAMKAIVWELVMLSNECCRLENEKK